MQPPHLPQQSRRLRHRMQKKKHMHITTLRDIQSSRIIIIIIIIIIVMPSVLSNSYTQSYYNSTNKPPTLPIELPHRRKGCNFPHSLVPSAACGGLRSSTMGSVTAIEAVNRQLPPIDRVQAVLFDVDGTLADSDPYHYLAFRDMLAEMCYNDGVPITEEFFSAFISGKHNHEIGQFLFPDWEQPRRDKWLDDKEALFRRMAAEHLEPVGGLLRLTEWVKQKGFRRAAVTNAPRENAIQMIAAVGLTDFFEHLVIGSECARAKPFPDPYLKALEHFGVPAENAFAFEDSPAGLGAAVAAGLPVVGITTGNPGPALMAAGAAFLIKDYDDPALWSKLE